MRIDSDGIVIGGAFFGFTVLVWVIFAITGWWVLRLAVYVSLALTVFALSFFRDPERIAPVGDDLAISAAEGVVIDVGRVNVDGFGETGALRIAVFMNVFNVHVNRSPVGGKVIRKKHWPGKKLSAYNKYAEYENEHSDTDIETAHGLIRVRQIAGLIARRVVNRTKEGEILHAGDRIGLIRFGSRVDVFLPLDYEPTVIPNSRVRVGETVIARLRKH